MIGWAEKGPALKALFTSLAADPNLPASGFEAEWHEGQRGYTSDRQRLTLTMLVTTVSSVGPDETRHEYVDPDSIDPDDAPYLDELRAIVVGQRRFTIQLRAIVPERTDTTWAHAALDRVRTGLERPSSIEALRAAGITLLEVRDAIKATFKDGGRVVNAAIMDCRFMTLSCDVDPVPVGWIEAVEVTSHMEDSGGTEIPAPQMVDELIPEGWTPSP